MTLPATSVGIDTFVSIAPLESAVASDGVSLEPKIPTNTDSLGVNPPAVSFTDVPPMTLSDDMISSNGRELTIVALG